MKSNKVNSAAAILLFSVLAISNASAVEPAKTTNGAFSDESFVANIGPTINFFAPVENMVTPEAYFDIIGVGFEKIGDASYRISPGEYTTLAQAYQLCQNTGIYTVNPPIDDLVLEKLFYAEVTGPPYQLSRLWNFSVRSEVKNGESVSVGGLVVPGRHPKIVVIRALGPSLQNYGIENALSDPQIDLVRSNAGVKFPPNVKVLPTTKILENDDHSSNYVSTDALLDWIGIDRPANESESVIATILDPGVYTTTLSSADGEHGVALLEFYILDAIDVTNTPAVE